MSTYTYNGTNSNDNVSTSDLQELYPSVTEGFIVYGLAGDDNIVSSFIGRNGVDLIVGGEGDDFMSTMTSTGTSKRTRLKGGAAAPTCCRCYPRSSTPMSAAPG